MSLVFRKELSGVAFTLTSTIDRVSTSTGLMADVVPSSSAAATSQRKDKLKKAQSQEWLAVGETASLFNAKTKTFLDGNASRPTHDVPADTMASKLEERKIRVQHWLEKPQTHEQLALGEKTSRSLAETSAFLDEIHGSVSQKTLDAGCSG